MRQKYFLSHSAENFRSGIFYCCINFGYRKSVEQRGVSRYYVENFFSHSAENLRRESFTVALISGTEKVLRRGGGVSRFSVIIFLSNSVEKFRTGIPYSCINFGYRKSLWTRRWKGVSIFSIENSLSHRAENLRRESFTVALISGVDKVWRRGGGEYQYSP